MGGPGAPLGIQSHPSVDLYPQTPEPATGLCSLRLAPDRSRWAPLAMRGPGPRFRESREGGTGRLGEEQARKPWTCILTPAVRPQASHKPSLSLCPYSPYGPRSSSESKQDKWASPSASPNTERAREAQVQCRAPRTGPGPSLCCPQPPPSPPAQLPPPRLFRMNLQQPSPQRPLPRG